MNRKAKARKQKQNAMNRKAKARKQKQKKYHACIGTFMYVQFTLKCIPAASKHKQIYNYFIPICITYTMQAIYSIL